MPSYAAELVGTGVHKLPLQCKHEVLNSSHHGGLDIGGNQDTAWIYIHMWGVLHGHFRQTTMALTTRKLCLS
jgi:hypothetical protein